MPQFYPALTKAQIEELQDICTDKPECKAVFWELARLRALVLGIARSIDNVQTGAARNSTLTLQIVMESLNREPVVIENPLEEVLTIFQKREREQAAKIKAKREAERAKLPEEFRVKRIEPKIAFDPRDDDL